MYGCTPSAPAVPRRCIYSPADPGNTRELKGRASDGSLVALNPLWRRRQTTKFNGASYLSQRGAVALYTPAGEAQVRETIDYYLGNARVILDGLRGAGYECFGGASLTLSISVSEEIDKEILPSVCL